MNAHSDDMAKRPPPDKPSQIVAHLAKEAKKQGQTPYALAKSTGLAITTVDRALAGRVDPTLGTAEALADALGLVVKVERKA